MRRQLGRVLVILPLLAPPGPLLAGDDAAIPDLEGATLLETADFDALVDIPGRESIVRYYVLPDKRVVAVTSIKNQAGKERIWSYTVDEDGHEPFDFVLVDVAGDGKFAKFAFGAVVDVGGWIIEYRDSH